MTQRTDLIVELSEIRSPAIALLTVTSCDIWFLLRTYTVSASVPVFLGCTSCFPLFLLVISLGVCILDLLHLAFLLSHSVLLALFVSDNRSSYRRSEMMIGSVKPARDQISEKVPEIILLLNYNGRSEQQKGKKIYAQGIHIYLATPYLGNH